MIVGPVQGVRLDCRRNPPEVAVAAGSQVLLLPVPANAALFGSDSLEPLQISDPPSGTFLVAPSGGGHLSAVAFSPDAARLAVGSRDGKASAGCQKSLS